ncbi:MAG: CopD family protein [Planctomycetota bacterium]|nr:CopD family protein [Planctomycetota bacterium]
MSSYQLFLVIHVLGATVWTGGHIVLCLCLLPNALKERSITKLQWFESRFETIGIPALIAQVITGVILSYRLLPSPSLWLSFSNPVSQVITLKFILLALTILLAADARLRIIPKLTEENLLSLAFHIIPVTLLSILFVVVGVSFGSGGL